MSKDCKTNIRHSTHLHDGPTMNDAREFDTSATLLMRLRDLDDREAWDAFVERYTPVIFSWCLRFQLQDSDASDVTQDVLFKLVRFMREFRYDPARGSFRGWLKTVTNNTVRDLAKSWKTRTRGSGDSAVAQMLSSIQSPESLASLASVIEAQYEQELLHAAEQRVKLRVKPHTWEAYRQVAVDRKPAATVAAELDMPIGEVYVAKSRVIKSLREEIRKLEGL